MWDRGDLGICGETWLASRDHAPGPPSAGDTELL